jgi:hypothetical protein
MSQLNITKDIKVHFLEKDVKYYLNQNMILFGASDSGKTTVLLEILHMLKKHIPLIFVFSLTAKENESFKGIVPDHVVRTDIDINALNSIWKRQKNATRTYNKANNINALQSLFRRVSNNQLIAVESMIIKHADRAIAQKNDDGTANRNEKKKAVKELQKMRDEHLTKLYKNIIKSNKKKLKKLKLNSAEAYVMKYLNFNPRCLLIFDDCGAILPKIQNEEVIKKLMFQGRHSHIQGIFTLQDDKSMAHHIKNQSKVSIFTTSQCALAYFSRKGAYFTSEIKKKSDKIITRVFASDGHKKHHRKLVYLRNDPDPFRYTVADLYEDFKFGSPALWKMSEKLKENKKNDEDYDDDDLMTTPFTIDL